ncbi:MAG: DUF2399 domain-containing protein [Rhodococcus sp. (in: high G+C Gram-positive bacteria)]|uniref:DUF2399 domain-containing protein n=1 Tax=Rhodococcus sp. TaxID=1831 RepID=UPI003BB49A1F
MSWAGSNELRVVLERARRHVQSKGLQVTGAITIPVTAEVPDLYRLAHAVGPTRVNSTSTKVRFEMSALDRWLRRPLNGGLSLLEVLNAQAPLTDRPGAKAAKARGIDTAWSQIDGILGAPELRRWRALMHTVDRIDAELLSGTMGDVARILAALPADGISPVELATNTLGDSKSLTATAVRKWVLRLLAADRGTAEPVTAIERMALWEQFGVIDSGLTSRVLTLGVRVEGAREAVTIADVTANAGMHQMWTLAQMLAWDVRLAPGDVYVCENPTVLQAAERELGPEHLPLVCTEGQPSEAVVHLLGTARGTVHWRADFDWTGLRTTARAQTELGAVPWRMDTATYRTGLARGAAETFKSGDSTSESPWDPDLAAEMTASGRAVMEEQVIPELLTDLRRRPPSAVPSSHSG